MTSSSVVTPKAIALKQIKAVHQEVDQLLNEIKAFSPPDASGQYAPTFRLIATPMLYSAWQRCFTLCHAVALRLIRDITPTASTLTASRRATWLIKAAFYRSLVDQIRINAASVKPKKGEFAILSEFLEEFDQWAVTALDPSITTDDLVMTFSNVNPDVVKINSQAIGIADFPQFKALKLGQLHDLVGQRNDIGHGGIIQPPTNDKFSELLKFTETLVNDYCDVFDAWIQAEF